MESLFYSWTHVLTICRTQFIAGATFAFLPGIWVALIMPAAVGLLTAGITTALIFRAVFALIG